MFSATHTYDSVNYVTGKIMVSINNQDTNNSNENTNDQQNNYKLNTPSDFIINNTNRYNQYICLVTPYYNTINHLIFPFVNMRHPMTSNIAAQNDSTYVRIRQTTKDYRLDFRGSDENYRGNVDVVFFSSRAHISHTLLFERFKINSTEDAIITGFDALDTNAEYELTNFDSNYYNLFFTPFLNSPFTNPGSITINFSIKIFSNINNKYTIKALGKDGDNNDDGYYDCAGKHFFWVAINKNIHNYYKKDEKSIIITGQSSNYHPNYVDISSYSLGDNDYTLLLSPIDSTENEMISLQIEEKTSIQFRIYGFVKDSRSGRTGGRKIESGYDTFQWAIIRETLKYH